MIRDFFAVDSGKYVCHLCNGTSFKAVFQSSCTLLTRTLSVKVCKSKMPKHVRVDCPGPPNPATYGSPAEYAYFMKFRKQTSQDDIDGKGPVPWEAVEQAWLDAFIDCNIPFWSASRQSFRTAFELTQIYVRKVRFRPLLNHSHP